MRLIAVILPFLIATPLCAENSGFASDAEATAVFAGGFKTACATAFDAEGKLIEPPKRFEVSHQTSWGEDSDMVIWQFECASFAYNTQQVYLLQGPAGTLLPVSLAEPAMAIVYDDPDSEESPLKSMNVKSWKASAVVMNSAFDPATAQISTYSLWRGVGDASEAGLWELRDEAFQLLRYSVDATYDGEVNPVVVAEFP